MSTTKKRKKAETTIDFVVQRQDWNGWTDEGAFAELKSAQTHKLMKETGSLNRWRIVERRTIDRVIE